MTWVRIPPGVVTWYSDLVLGHGFKSDLGQLTLSLKRRESQPSLLALLCCLALFNVSQLFNHTYIGGLPQYRTCLS